MTSAPIKEYLQNKWQNLGNHPNRPEEGLSPAFPYSSGNTSLGYQFGNKVTDFINGHRVLRPLGAYLNSLGRSPWLAAGLGGLAGAAIGAGSSLFSDDAHPLRRALLGGALGAGGSLLLSHMVGPQEEPPQVKSSFYATPGGPNPIQFIQTRLFGDSSVGPGDKSMLMGMLPNLNHDQLEELSSVLRTGAGAGAGALIAKFLFKFGLGGTALMALVGGLASHAFGGKPRNAFGDQVDTEYDPFGRRHLV